MSALRANLAVLARPPPEPAGAPSSEGPSGPLGKKSRSAEGGAESMSTNGVEARCWRSAGELLPLATAMSGLCIQQRSWLRSYAAVWQQALICRTHTSDSKQRLPRRAALADEESTGQEDRRGLRERLNRPTGFPSLVEVSATKLQHARNLNVQQRAMNLYRPDGKPNRCTPDQTRVRRSGPSTTIR